MTNLTPLKAIKLRCIDCSGDDNPKNCVCVRCPLYAFRLGKNPFAKREISEACKKQLMKNLKIGN